MSLTQPSVLVVDDTAQNLNVASRILREHYRALVALDGNKALEIARSEDAPDLILLDVMMPGLNGYEVCRQLKADEKTRDIPVIFLTALDEATSEAAGFEVGAVDYITKPISPATMLARVRTHLQLRAHEKHLKEMVSQRTHALEERTRELEETRLEVIRRLGRAAEYKDDATGLHVIRMSQYAKLLALSAGFSEDRAELLFNAAPMHDIGKIGIPDHILQKPSALTVEEWDIMRQHPAIGAGIIGKQENELLQAARVVALTHHEKWNGSGYPRNRVGKDIPIEGRIVAVADVFDALTSKRPYKEAWPIEQALDFLRKESGSHFDPDLIPRFLELVPEVTRVKNEYSDH